MNKSLWILAALIALVAACSVSESADTGDDDVADDDTDDDSADDDTDGDDDDGSEMAGVWTCDEFGGEHNGVVPERIELYANGQCPGSSCSWRAEGGNAEVNGYYDDTMTQSLYFILVNYRVSNNTMTAAYYGYDVGVLYLMHCERQD